MNDTFRVNMPEGPDEQMLQSQLRDKLFEIMGELTPREQRVLELRYGLNNGWVHTLEATGSRLDLTKERIRQIQREALRWLRHPSRSKVLREYL